MPFIISKSLLSIAAKQKQLYEELVGCANERREQLLLPFSSPLLLSSFPLLGFFFFFLKVFFD
jgi:hypothetical protein